MPSNMLDVQVELKGSTLRAAVPDDNNNWKPAFSEFPFDDDVGLPAILKLLNREAFSARDYFEPEVAFLRARGYIIDGLDSSGAPGLARDLRRKLGLELFELLFSTEEARRLFDNAYGKRASAHVQFSFNADRSTVLAVPWELLYRDQDFLFGGNRATFSRRLAYSQLQYDRPQIDIERLRVLLVAPRPKGVPALGWADGKAITSVAQLDVEQLPEAPTFAALNTYVGTHRGSKAPHVVHFDGHGAFGRKCVNRHINARLYEKCQTCGVSLQGEDVQGYLAFEDANGDVDYVSAQTMANTLGILADGEQSSLRLVLVSACRSGVATGGSAFSGIAQRLIKARAPAVVAMQFEVQEDFAAEFARHFYKSVVQNESLPNALRLARTLIAGLGDDQWYRPVLYLGTNDNPEGQFFNFTAPRVAIQVVPRIKELPAESARNLTDAIRRGLSRLRDQAANRTVGDQLAPFARTFKDVADELELLADYKGLHDQLHELYYDWFVPAKNQLAVLDESPSVLTGLDVTVMSAERRIDALKDLAEEARDRVEPERLAWIGQLETIYTAFADSLSQRDRPGAAKAIRRMGTELALRSTQINEWIVSTASDVHLERVADAMGIVNSDPLVLAAGGAVEGLRLRLDSLVAEHNRWQELEPNLKELQRNLQSDVQAFVDDWPDTLHRLMELCEGQPEIKVQRLKQKCSDVDEVWQQLVVDGLWRGSDTQLQDLRTKYMLCEREAGQRFVLVDKDLMALCKEVNDLHAPLVDLAEELLGAPV